MIKMKKVLTVSIIAIMASATAHAEIASRAYVDTSIQSVNTDVTALQNKVGTGAISNSILELNNEDAVTDLVSAVNSMSARLGLNDSYGPTDSLVNHIDYLDEHKVDDTRTVNGHALNEDVTVTKGDVGLGNVDNTSDLNKPISTATQTALNAKQDTISDLATIRSGAAAGATALQPGDIVDGRDNDGVSVYVDEEEEICSRDDCGSNPNYGKLVVDASPLAERVSDLEQLSLNKYGHDENKAVITNDMGAITTGTIASGMIADSAVTSAKIADQTIMNADISTNASIDGIKVDAATDSVRGTTKVYTTTGNNTDGTMTQGAITTALNAKQDKLVAAAGATQNITGAGSVTVTQDANGKITISGAETDVSGKVDKTVAGEADKIMVRNSSGTMVPAAFATYEDDKGDEHAQLSVSNGTITVNYAENAGYAFEAGYADNADNAEIAKMAGRDSDGNFINTTYVKKAQGSSAQNKAVITDASGNVTTGTIASGMITDGTIMNADINANAAIAQSKIDGLTTALSNAQNKIPSGSENSSTLASIWVE